MSGHIFCCHNWGAGVCHRDQVGRGRRCCQAQYTTWDSPPPHHTQNDLVQNDYGVTVITPRLKESWKRRGEVTSHLSTRHCNWLTGQRGGKRSARRTGLRLWGGHDLCVSGEVNPRLLRSRREKRSCHTSNVLCTGVFARHPDRASRK